MHNDKISLLKQHVNIRLSSIVWKKKTYNELLYDTNELSKLVLNSTWVLNKLPDVVGFLRGLIEKHIALCYDRTKNDVGTSAYTSL